MVNMQYFDCTSLDPIENLVRVSYKGHDAHAWTLCNSLSALRPRRYPQKYRAKACTYRFGIFRIVCCDVRADFLEIFEGRFSIPDPHAQRNFAKTAATFFLVANRPLRAALNPRSIPFSSFRVA